MNPIDRLWRAEKAVERGRFRAALEILRMIRISPDAESLRAEVHSHTAESLRGLGRFSAALPHYWEAHRLYRLSGNDYDRWEMLLGASACLRILGRFRQAQRAWNSVDRLLPRNGRRSQRWDIIWERAMVERGLEDFPKAVRMLKSCAVGYRRLGDAEGLYHTAWAVGGAHRFQGRLRTALLDYRTCLKASRAMKDSLSEGYALCGAAGVSRLLGVGNSQELYRRAYRLFKTRREVYGQAYGLCGMGNAERVYGDPRRALSFYARSAPLYRRVGDEGSLAFVYWGMGGALRRLKRSGPARRCYHRSGKLFKKAGDIRGRIMSELGLARTEHDRPSVAETHYRTARRLALQNGFVLEEGHVLWGWTQLRRTPPRKALSFYRRLGIPRSTVLRWRDIP
ncbi:MAG TPA: hypothetical protein PK876_07900 [Elusimicrobiota bacterium]|nr:hypothetical protein [Elusimicrobiota bacterium]